MASRRFTNGDWMSQGICKFIPEIEQISEMPHGVVPALELTFLLGKFSYTTLADVRPNYPFSKILGPDGKQSFSRPSDPLADDLVVKLVGKAEDLEEWKSFDVGKELKSLRKQREYLTDYGITGYFSKSVDVLTKLQA